MELGQAYGKYTVTGIKTIKHGKYYPNIDVKEIIALQGKRGAKATAHVLQSGEVGALMTGGFGYFEGNRVLDGTVKKRDNMTFLEFVLMLNVLKIFVGESPSIWEGVMSGRYTAYFDSFAITLEVDGSLEYYEI